MKAKEIRDTYLSFFAERGHKIVPSASLVPSVHDPSVLLTTAGMQPFKPYFLGREKPPAPRLADVQKCFRTTDIEEVGNTARHMSYAKSKNLTVYDVLTIASMIEREAGVASQRKLVASVVYNRLHEGIPLGIDATIRFATGNYSEPLTESELAVDSPYNTRTNAGLPPGPINSPGIDAIEAAAHPAKTDYLFYVNKPNTCNELAFSKNEAEFEADVQRYEDAREANGGNEPSSCGE